VAFADDDEADFTGTSRPLHGTFLGGHAADGEPLGCIPDPSRLTKRRLMARMAQRPPKQPGPLARLGRRYASKRRPWSLAVTALVIGTAVIVVGAFFLANKQFAVALGAATFGIVLAWLLRVRAPR
jgi:hypothetical protein